MSQRFHIHPDNPQPRLINLVVKCLRDGGVIVCPTDTSYALICHMGDKAALDRVRRIRQLDDKHHFTLLCRNLSEISDYAKVDNVVYRLIKRLTPGAYTFILKATREVPRRLMHAKRKTIGLRVPDNAVLIAILDQLQEPVMSTTLILPGRDQPLNDPDDIEDLLQNQVDAIVDGGVCGFDVTTMVDLSTETMLILREGKGEIAHLQDESLTH